MAELDSFLADNGSDSASDTTPTTGGSFSPDEATTDSSLPTGPSPVTSSTRNEPVDPAATTEKANKSSAVSVSMMSEGDLEVSDEEDESLRLVYEGQIITGKKAGGPTNDNPNGATVGAATTSTAARTPAEPEGTKTGEHNHSMKITDKNSSSNKNDSNSKMDKIKINLSDSYQALVDGVIGADKLCHKGDATGPFDDGDEELSTSRNTVDSKDHSYWTYADESYLSAPEASAGHRRSALFNDENQSRGIGQEDQAALLRLKSGSVFDKDRSVGGAASRLRRNKARRKRRVRRRRKEKRGKSLEREISATIIERAAMEKSLFVPRNEISDTSVADILNDLALVSADILDDTEGPPGEPALVEDTDKKTIPLLTMASPQPDRQGKVADQSAGEMYSRSVIDGEEDELDRAATSVAGGSVCPTGADATLDEKSIVDEIIQRITSNGVAVPQSVIGSAIGSPSQVQSPASSPGGVDDLLGVHAAGGDRQGTGDNTDEKDTKVHGVDRVKSPDAFEGLSPLADRQRSDDGWVAFPVSPFGASKRQPASLSSIPNEGDGDDANVGLRQGMNVPTNASPIVAVPTEQSNVNSLAFPDLEGTTDPPEGSSSSPLAGSGKKTHRLVFMDDGEYENSLRDSRNGAHGRAPKDRNNSHDDDDDDDEWTSFEAGNPFLHEETTSTVISTLSVPQTLVMSNLSRRAMDRRESMRKTKPANVDSPKSVAVGREATNNWDNYADVTPTRFEI